MPAILQQYSLLFVQHEPIFLVTTIIYSVSFFSFCSEIVSEIFSIISIGIARNFLMDMECFGFLCGAQHSLSFGWKCVAKSGGSVSCEQCARKWTAYTFWSACVCVWATVISISGAQNRDRPSPKKRIIQLLALICTNLELHLIEIGFGLAFCFLFISYRTWFVRRIFFSRVFKCARLAHKTLNTGTVLIGGTVQERVRYI